MWLGQAASTIGEEVYRVAVVWLAVEAVGNLAARVNAAQYLAMLVVGLLGAPLIDRWRADRAMIGSKIGSAALALVPVLGFYIWGVSVPLLVLSVMGIAALRMVFTPALQQTIPLLAPDRAALQAVNGLIDITWRLARLFGPAVTAFLELFLPVIHFLSATAIGFALSALAMATIRDRLVDRDAKPRPAGGGWRGAWESMTEGARLMRRERIMGFLILMNALVMGPWSVALQLALALIVKEHNPTSFGIDGLAALAVIISFVGVGDVLGNLLVASLRLRRPLSTMFLGYVAMGGGFAVMAVCVWILPNPYMLPAMMLAGFVGGVGGPFFFIPMITRLQTVYRGPEIARVFRLRLAIMAAAMLIANVAAEPLFDWIGAALTELLCGLFIVAVGLGGHWHFRRLENRGTI